MRSKQLEAVHDYVKNIFSSDTTGHDFYHMRRVAHMAKSLAEKENGDSFICEVGGWVHDIGDPKLFSRPNEAIQQMNEFLNSIELTNKEIDKIQTAIKNISFSIGKKPSTIEGKIVQDADRLDAIGAIGIARTFAYGGANEQLIFHDVHHKNTSIQHFYDKLLKLKEQMNTKSAKEIAVRRHKIMEQFLQQFYNEWKHE